MTAVYFGIAWLMGIWLAASLDWALSIWLTMGAIGLVGGALFRRRAPVGLALFSVAALGIGGGRYVTTVPHITSSHIAYYNDSETLTMTGLVVDEPDIRDRFTNLRVRVETLILPDGSEQPVTGDVLVRAFRYPVISYGARLELDGRLETPPEWEDFSYKDYLTRQGVHSLVNTPQLTILAENEGNSLYQAIFAFKARAQTAINRLIPEPQAALLSGILLGNDNGLAPDLADDFRNTGMTHIIAISGQVGMI